MTQTTLIVEDEKLICELLALVLPTFFEGRVFCANTLEDAERLLLEKTPDVVLLDFWLDGRRVNSMTLIEFAKRLPRAPRFLVMSADPRAKIEAEKLGLPFLHKPFDLDAIVEFVRTPVE